jgi:hypothetical protein
MPNSIQPFAEGQLNKIVDDIGDVILSLSHHESIEFLRWLSFRLAQKQAELEELAKSETSARDDPSDIGAPSGAPKPIPVPPEVIAEALREFNETEIIEAIRELKRGGGYQLKDILPKLESAIESPAAHQ